MKLKGVESAITLLLWQLLILLCQGEYTLQTIRDVVGAGNYTYYKLKKAGSVRLMLTSSQGDADLYVSSETMQPDYEYYDLKAASCGVDIIDIPLEAQRPIGVGVYGHFSAEVTQYTLEIIVYEDASFESTANTKSGQHSSGNFAHPNTKKDEEESLISTILVGIIKLILDILL